MSAKGVHRLRWRTIAAYTSLICLVSMVGGLVVKVLANMHIVSRLMVGPLNGASAIIALVGSFTALSRNQAARPAAYAFWVAVCAWTVAGLNVLASVLTIAQWLGTALVIAAAAGLGVGLGSELRRRPEKAAPGAPRRG